MASAAPPAPPANYWGDEPEEEFYAKQGVKNAKAPFPTKHGSIFTQTFQPVEGRVKGLVCFSHGYGSDTGWMFQSIAIEVARWGYTAAAADLLGHGRSDGLHGYVFSLDAFAESQLEFFQSMREQEQYRGLPAFLFGESMGGAVTLLMHWLDPAGWTGAVLSAPLLKIPQGMLPPWWVKLTAFPVLSLADSWAVVAENNIVRKSIRDPVKAKAIASNPRRYTGKPRVGTMRELQRVCDYFEQNFERCSLPFLALHGTEDVVADIEGTKALFERASSSDKTLKIYEEARHSLIQGEPDESRAVVLADIKAWLEERVEKHDSQIKS